MLLSRFWWFAANCDALWAGVGQFCGFADLCCCYLSVGLGLVLVVVVLGLTVYSSMIALVFGWVCGSIRVGVWWLVVWFGGFGCDLL